MGLYDLLSNTPEEILGEQFDRSIDSVIELCGGNTLIASVMSFSALTKTYDSLKDDDAIIQKCGLSKSDYLHLLETVFHKKGHEYYSNWDQLMNGSEKDSMDIDYMDIDYMDMDSVDLDYMDFDF